MLDKTSVKTPCIGVCSTIYGDRVCRGCYRFYHEIVHWNIYSTQQKQLVWSRLEQTFTHVLSRKIKIKNNHRLARALKAHKIRFPAHLNAYCWAAALFSHNHHAPLNLDEFGLAVLPAYRQYNLKVFFNLIRSELFDLSMAYYDNHIERAFRHEDLANRLNEI